MVVIILIVLIPVLAIVISVAIFAFVHAFIERLSFYKRIKRICKEQNYKIALPRKLFASFFRYCHKPDVIIETPNKKYLLRFITCKNKSLFYNFPTPEWYVSFERVLSAPINPTGRFKHLPPFDEAYYSDNTENKCIMVFAPRMPKISYLKDENSKRELAGNAITIGEWTIFESKKFLTSI